MAKIGEGDPRWLVKDMGESGTNVNGWHWTEKDCLSWCKTRLNQLFDGTKLVSGPIEVTGGQVDTITGEAFLNNRKNKVIASYELELKIKWTASIRDGDGNEVGSASGKLHLPYVADENHDEDPELKITCDVNDSSSQRAKDAILGKGKQAVLGAIHTMIKELRAGVPSGKQGDSTAAEAPAAAAAAASKPSSAAAAPAAQPAAAPKASSSAARSKADAGKQFTLTQKFYARPRDLYECLTQEARVKAYTQSQASSDPKPGGKFTWFSGAVTGEYLQLEPEKRVVMSWRFSTWEEGCSSRVAITLEEPSEGTTVLTLKQTGIPDSDKYGNDDALETTRKGWEGQILQRIRMVFGYGTGM